MIHKLQSIVLRHLLIHNPHQLVSHDLQAKRLDELELHLCNTVPVCTRTNF